MPLLPPITVPPNPTIDELAGIVGRLNKTVSWLSGALDKVYVQQDGDSGQNMLMDHSFEMLPASGSADAEQTFAINDTMLGNFYWWNITGTPRVRSTYNASVTPFSLFGLQGAVVNDTNYLWQQQIPTVAVPSGPYCFSVHAAPKGGNTVGAQLQCTLVIRAIDSSDVELGTVTRSFTVCDSYSSADNGKWSRGFVTYKELPATTAYLEVQVKSASSEWLEVDGAQLVPQETPKVYNPENQLWAHIHSLDGAKHDGLQTLGTVTVADPTNTYWAFLTPGVGSTNKLVIASDVGIEHNTIYDGSGTIMYACNSEGKNYAPWVQLQDGSTTTSPAAGALRSVGGSLQVYDGAVWHTIATQDWVNAQGFATQAWVAANYTHI